MPFTLFHLGPGAAFKAIGGRHFSFMVFGGSQVLMDIEVLARMHLGTPVLHGYTHSVAGALAIGALSTFTGKPVSEFVLRWRKIPHYPISWLAAAMGAFVGTFSHIVLDAIVHDDMRPWWPIGSGNGLLGLMGYENLQWWCVALGVVGAIGVGVRFAKRGRA
jgi:hypothetical protein